MSLVLVGGESKKCPDGGFPEEFTPWVERSTICGEDSRAAFG